MKSPAEFIVEQLPSLNTTLLHYLSDHARIYLGFGMTQYAEYYHEEKMKELSVDEQDVTFEKHVLDKFETVHAVWNGLAETRKYFDNRLNDLETIDFINLKNRILAVENYIDSIKQNAFFGKLNKLLQRNERAWKLHEDFELKFTDRLGKLEHFSKELQEFCKQNVRASENIANTVTTHWETQGKLRQDVDNQISERIANLEQDLKTRISQLELNYSTQQRSPKVEEFKEVEEEIRPQVGEVWESRCGCEFIIDDINLNGFPDRQLSGHPIKNVHGNKIGKSAKWYFNGKYWPDDDFEADLIKKISDAPKPESKLPQPGEIWLARNKEYNLVLKNTCGFDQKLATITPEGRCYHLYSDGKASKDWDEHNSMFDLIEKTDLTFADFLKLNRGE